MSPWRKVFLRLPMSTSSDPGHDQLYFSLQDSSHLVLYHTYLCFSIFGSIHNERKYFIFYGNYWVSTWTFCACKKEICTGNYLESNWRVTENLNKACSHLTYWRVQDKELTTSKGNITNVFSKNKIILWTILKSNKYSDSHQQNIVRKTSLLSSRFRNE